MFIRKLISALLVLGAGFTTSACWQLPVAGPHSSDIKAPQPDSPDLLPYALVRVTPDVIRILADFAPRLAASPGPIASRGPSPTDIKFGIGDVVSVTVFEAAAGGLFIP